MFFGRREAAESLPPDALYSLLDHLFNKRMSQLETKALGIVKELHRARDQFVEVCKDFEKLDAEPYTEDIWMPNMNAIKSQKEQYAATLTEIAEGLDLKVNTSIDIYSRYRGLLSNVEEMTNSALRTNSKFKQSFYCYSRHLGGFKRSSAHFDRIMGTLRNELDRRSGEFERYTRVREQISSLKAQQEELGILIDGIAALRSSFKPADKVIVGKIESETRNKLVGKVSELAVVSEEISRLSSRISIITAPLERASRKFDHLTLRKKSLHGFIADPIGTIRNEVEYGDFVELVRELGKNVDSGSIESKNAADLSNSISNLLNYDVYYLITSLKALETKKSEINSERRELERTLGELGLGKESAAMSLNQIRRMEANCDRISGSIGLLKSEIENEFSLGYGKSVSIVL